MMQSFLCLGIAAVLWIGAIAAFTASASADGAYQPPKDIGRTRRSGSSGGRIAERQKWIDAFQSVGVSEQKAEEMLDRILDRQK